MQNGSLHQKETVHDNDFEPYLTSQSNQVRFPTSLLFLQNNLPCTQVVMAMSPIKSVDIEFGVCFKYLQV